VPVFDVLSVGDVATDIFIRLLEGRVVIRDDPSGRWLMFPFGDKVPFDHVLTVEAGGNAANAAVGFARLGLTTALATDTGDDQIGRDMRAALQREGVDTRFIRADPELPSNRNFVLWFRDDRTILVHRQSYDYRWPDLHPDELPRWLYLSSVGCQTSHYVTILKWLRAVPTVRFAFQPGTFEIAQGVRSLAGLYRRADVLVCNREEAVEIGGGDHADMANLLECLRRLGPETVVVTDGPAGAYACDGTHRYFVPSLPDRSPPIDRTGAGDAFTSTLVAALAKGRPLAEALTWAPVNARTVVREVGSQTGLLTEKALVDELAAAPPSYTVSTW